MLDGESGSVNQRFAVLLVGGCYGGVGETRTLTLTFF